MNTHKDAPDWPRIDPEVEVAVAVEALTQAIESIKKDKNGQFTLAFLYINEANYVQSGLLGRPLNTLGKKHLREGLAWISREADLMSPEAK